MARILIAGDDCADRELLAAVAEFRGHICATAGSLDEAVNLLQKGLFDVAVADMKLSGNAPEEIVRRLKDASADLGLVALAAPDCAVSAADETLPVPCPPEDLIQLINRALGKVLGRRARYSRERRRFTRYPVDLPCVIRDLQGAKGLTETPGRIVNLSRGGLYAWTNGDWKIGKSIECAIQLCSNMIASHKGMRAQGKVVRLVQQEESRTGIGATIETFEFTDWK